MNPDVEQSSTFPAAGYARHILEPAFRFGQRELFEAMMAANKAHAVMLVEQGTVDPERGGRLISGILDAEVAGAESYRYDPAVEDLFFAVERRIIEIAGDDAGGNLQLGRSRNDLSAALCRMALRRRLLTLADLHCGLRKRVGSLAGDHIDTVMRGVTHTQDAQPTTLAHYLLGVLGPIGRDAARMRLAYDHTNQSPLGVAAFTSSSLPVERDRLASLLGFDGIVENGYDAVGAADYMLETVSTLRTCCLSLIRFVNDLLIWGRTDVGIVQVGDEFIQISSIMPQKRNPVVLEHIRARIGYVLGDAATVEAMVHTAAFGDTVDVEDEIFVPLLRCCDHAASVFTLLSDVLATIRVDREQLAEAARSGFGACTELAERLTIDGGLSFREAHGVVGWIVQDLAADGKDLRALTPEMVELIVHSLSGKRVALTKDILRGVTDPFEFVARRSILGGPAPVAVRKALTRELKSREADQLWVNQARSRLEQADNTLDLASRKLVERSRR